ncbi:uncharacterized protein LOC111297840 [Durio zibethinus]|uniref:Uncharacterized protein LOC111297840 n=1 Tax=Durio zibethinus TaxID=66656 RepID=A0A6P5Z6I6_DURZI|nr:uncharacterized protein LOC111297840 [Durio zibethinus]
MLLPFTPKPFPFPTSHSLFLASKRISDKTSGPSISIPNIIIRSNTGTPRYTGSNPKQLNSTQLPLSPGTFESLNQSSDAGSRPEDPVSTLFQMFPALDPELMTFSLRNHNNKIEDPRESWTALSSDLEERNKPHSFDSERIGNCSDLPMEGTSTCSQISEHNIEDVNNIKQKFGNGTAIDSPKWVDLFVQEMMSAKNIDDVRGRAARILEAFEGSITNNKRAAEEVI